MPDLRSKPAEYCCQSLGTVCAAEKVGSNFRQKVCKVGWSTFVCCMARCCSACGLIKGAKHVATILGSQLMLVTVCRLLIVTVSLVITEWHYGG